MDDVDKEEDSTYSGVTGDEEPDYEPDTQQGHIQNLNSVDRFFNTESLLYHIKMSLLGYRVDNGRYVNTGQGLARTPVVEKLINSLRSVINTENMLSRFQDEDDANTVLLEKCKECIYALYDDPTVDESDFEHMVNMLDHPMQLFVGIIQSGQGSESARQMLTGNYQNLQNQSNNSQPLFRLGSTNTDWFTFGGKR